MSLITPSLILLSCKGRNYPHNEGRYKKLKETIFLEHEMDINFGNFRAGLYIQRKCTRKSLLDI